MRQIEAYPELNAMIMRQFRRGMVTNSFLSKEEYESEIAHGTLVYQEFENGLFIHRMRESHAILNFWLNDGFAWENLRFSPNTVLEIPHRERDTGLIKAVEMWKNVGFSSEFLRERMVCSDFCDNFAETDIKYAKPDEFETVKALLYENFSPLTGCLPTDGVIMRNIEEGEILLYKINHNPLGLLHFTKDSKRTELRHLCVKKASRGQGIGRELVYEFNRITNGMTRHIWVRNDNLPALMLYKNCGYRADGMTSDVLIRR